MKIHIHHRTSYQYALKVLLGAHRLMMRPRESHGIRIETCSFAISVPHRIRWTRDLHENNVGLIDFTELASELIIEGDFTLDVTEKNPFDFILLPEAAEYPFSYDHELLTELLPLSQNLYVRDVDRIRNWLNPFWHPGKKIGTLELLQLLNLHIYRNFRYQRREKKGVLSPAETLENNGGSCRDFATLFMEICRFMGLAARFVSGYMYSTDIDGRMSMHGWAEVYLPGAGWIGFDPSWGLLAASNYFPVAVTRHSEYAPPIAGTYVTGATDAVVLCCVAELPVKAESCAVRVAVCEVKAAEVFAVVAGWPWFTDANWLLFWLAASRCAVCCPVGLVWDAFMAVLSCAVGLAVTPPVPLKLARLVPE